MTAARYVISEKSQGISLEEAVRRAHLERNAAIRKGFRRLWNAKPRRGENSPTIQ